MISSVSAIACHSVPHRRCVLPESAVGQSTANTVVRAEAQFSVVYWERVKTGQWWVKDFLTNRHFVEVVGSVRSHLFRGDRLTRSTMADPIPGSRNLFVSRLTGFTVARRVLPYPCRSRVAQTPKTNRLQIFSTGILNHD
jgi:hypothetical protein